MLFSFPLASGRLGGGSETVPLSAARWQVEAVLRVRLDNTGDGAYSPAVVVPTLDFPSDHVIVAADLRFRLDRRAVAGAPLPCRRSDRDCETVQAAESDLGHLPPPAVWPADASAAEACPSMPDPGAMAAESTAPPCANAASGVAAAHDGWLGGVARSLLLSQQVGGGREDEALAALDPDEYGEDPDAFCERHFTRFVTGSVCGSLDRKNRELAASEDRAIGILFSSRPFSIVMSKPAGQLGLLVSALIFLAELALNAWAVQYFAFLSGDAFRLATYGLGNSSAQSVTPGSATFGVMKGGCPVLQTKGQNLSTAFDAGRGLAVYGSQLLFVDGWYLDVQENSSDPWEDQAELSFERFVEGAWQRVENPPWLRLSTQRALRKGLGAKITVDLRPPWQWLLQWCAGQAGLALGCITASACGTAGQGRWAAWACVVTYLLFAVISAVVALSHSNSVIAEDQETAISECVVCVGFLLLAGVLAKEKYVAACFPWAYLMICLAIVFDRCAFYPNMLGFMSLTFPILWAGTPVLVGLCEVFGTLLIRRWVIRDLMKVDNQMFDSVWQAFLLHDRKFGFLTALDLCAKQISKNCTSSDIRQRHRGNQNFTARTIDDIFSPSSISGSGFLNLPLVSNLDQLYSQAACLNIFLRKKIRLLALKTNGMFAVLNQIERRTYECYKTITNNAQQVKFAKLKPTRRALEKLLRVYDCDVSLLLDCCRQSIYFDNIEDLLSCLQEIRSDKELIIAKIQNRMKESYQSIFSGGYRYNVFLICVRRFLSDIIHTEALSSTFE